MVNCSNTAIINGIQLMQSDESILSLTSNNEIRWHDLVLKNRSKAKAKTSSSDGDLSYLRVEISSSMIKPVKDSGLGKFYWQQTKDVLLKKKCCLQNNFKTRLGVGTMSKSVHLASGRLGVRIPPATDLSRKNRQ